MFVVMIVSSLSCVLPRRPLLSIQGLVEAKYQSLRMISDTRCKELHDKNGRAQQGDGYPHQKAGPMAHSKRVARPNNTPDCSVKLGWSGIHGQLNVRKDVRTKVLYNHKSWSESCEERT